MDICGYLKRITDNCQVLLIRSSGSASHTIRTRIKWKQKDNKKILFPQKNRSITKTTKKNRHCRVPTAIIDSIISKFEESDLDFCLQKKIYCSTAGKVEDRSTF